MNKGTNTQHNSSLGWFNLARLVSQGEKEKALGLYRLLSYSFEDKAFALQVEADLLKFFDDRSAVDKYIQAAFLYKKESKLVSAASIYEHVLSIDPNNFEYQAALLELYAILDWQERLLNRTSIMLDHFDKKHISKDKVSKIIDLVVEQFVLANNTKGLNDFKGLIASRNPSIL